MTELMDFERRLLQALTEVDARRPAAPAATAGGAQRRPAARRPLAALAATTALMVGTTAFAAASGLFPAAPVEVRRIFGGLDGGGGVDADRAVRIGVVDDHVAYAAPTADGGFCLHFASNPRSGPTGETCVPRGARPDEVLFTVLAGTDGILVFGRTGAPGAATVVVRFPGDGGEVRVPVAGSGFFGAPVPERAEDTFVTLQEPGPKDPPTKDGGPMRVFDPARVADVRVVAVDARGTPVAHGVTSLDWIAG